MKKLLFLAFVVSVMLLSGCTSADGPTLTTAESEEFSEFRTENELIAIAEEAPGIFDEVQSRSSRKISSGLIRVNAANSRSEDAAAVYAVNFDDGQGFVLVTDNREMEGLLAYVPDGSYSEDLLNEVASLGATLIPGIEPIPGITLPLDPTDPNPNPNPNPNPDPDPDPFPLKRRVTKNVRETQTLANVPQKVKVEWGQGYPANYYQENFWVIGCAPVAAAQAMSYYEPASINLTFKNAGQNSVKFNWADIKKHKEYHDSYGYSCAASMDAHRQIGFLCREIAERSYTDFKSYDLAVTADIMIASALSQMFSSSRKVSQATDLKNFKDLQTGIKEGIVLMSATPSENSNIGHMFVLDGYKTLKHVDITYWRYEDESTWHVLFDYTKTGTYYHINWGYDGKANGYYSQGLFQFSKAYSYDHPEMEIKNDAAYNCRPRIITIK